MYVLMRKFPSGCNQHNIEYSERPEGVTEDLETAKAWCKDIDFGWSGKQYFVEVDFVWNVI